MSLDIRNMDCLEYMRNCKDNEFDLAIVDVPYGISVDEWMANDSNTQRGKSATKRGEYVDKNWDKTPPTDEYFTQLFRISKNQIIWGANHFIEKINRNSSCWLVWDKVNGDNGYADCELAWTSFKSAVRKVKYRWHGMLQADMKNKEVRIHPTQKPMKLYAWILDTYAKKGQRILDTHLGSASSAIAAHYFDCDFVGLEIDKEYFDKAMKRIKNETAQIAISFNHSIISCGEGKKEENKKENVA